jgi:hypothetical protein
MIAAISGDAIPSARRKPVATMMPPAIAVAMNANRSVRMCWNATSTLPVGLAQRPARLEVDDDPDERDDPHRSPWTAGGVTSRRMPS